MAIVADRIKETSTTTGTGNFTISGASTGFRTFSSAFALGADFFYAIVAQTPGEWEVGAGHLVDSTTIARLEVLSSSNSNALVNFSAGTKDVIVTFPASQFQNKGQIYSRMSCLVMN